MQTVIPWIRAGKVGLNQISICPFIVPVGAACTKFHAKFKFTNASHCMKDRTDANHVLGCGDFRRLWVCYRLLWFSDVIAGIVAFLDLTNSVFNPFPGRLDEDSNMRMIVQRTYAQVIVTGMHIEIELCDNSSFGYDGRNNFVWTYFYEGFFSFSGVIWRGFIWQFSILLMDMNAQIEFIFSLLVFGCFSFNDAELGVTTVWTNLPLELSTQWKVLRRET